MRLWRLLQPEHAPGLDGEGARLWGGRWNSAGRPMVYCASSLALAVLEYFVHVPVGMRRAGGLPQLVAVELELPERPLDKLEAGSQEEARSAGDSWLADGKDLAVLVASAVVSLEDNALLNPLHPDMARLQVLRQVPFDFDPRMVG